MKWKSVPSASRSRALIVVVGSVLGSGLLACGEELGDQPAPATSGTVPVGSDEPGATPPTGLEPGSEPTVGSSGPVPTTGATGANPPAAVPSSTQPSDPTEGPGAVQPATCQGTDVVAPKRMVRLTFNQYANSIRSLLGDEVADLVSTTFEIGDPTSRTFPPLNNPREGSVIIDGQFAQTDGIAQAAARQVFDQFVTVTGCEATDDACAQSFVSDFGERAFRRPLTADEHDRLLGVYAKALAEGASVEQAVQYSVYAALSAPQVLYRTEFGEDSAVEGSLSPYELASQISYFVTDGPPDDELLEAAEASALSTPEQIAAQVDRLLATDGAKINLEAAIYAYFGIPTLGSIIVDPGVAPDFTEGLRASMMREVQLFLGETLWSGSLQDLLLSRRSYANASLADVYGVSVGTPLDADGFGPVMLPENRSGMLTNPAFLTTRSSPERPSVVRRGLLVNASILCATNPPFPEDPELVEQIENQTAATAELTEREKAEQRAKDSPCNTCHIAFDAYGLGLDNFDVIGRFREVDPKGRPIDAQVTLPSTAGGATVSTPAEMAAEISKSGAFTRCMTKNLLAYALAEGAQLSTLSCSTQAIADGFASSDQSFSALVREVAVSRTFSVRSAGGTQ